ncbi:phosphatidylinositol 4-kinase gamma 5-like [Punica granatum]|uniref:Phosphatidylinositol 4-kinase gamma 5-like n=2 Tax=Punica granatum TaxID=22663 RepID=A0A6P8DL48_PUNGR|nr:phosphatidylinositol 4-kinase gamma 5-like [Punica granatum]XP_031395125.1 phosphatidylinositol 4-kinase gamma 5-like [Punica granatum]XP_031395126.1 phosphatidylinositol 4-kinase gamma 5-like [Punica granatum]PKI69869.1 hypothetical protein CRG98_009744 [Punica granatum]
MAAAAFRGPLNGEYRGSNGMDSKPSARRRVFVQTETGCVMGIELERSDNAHTVKRRLQLALNVPTDECSLLYGDMILKNDLSTVRNDSPLLLARNLMHRSSSTPCLSPTGKDLQQRDRSGPIEILSCPTPSAWSKQLIKEIVKAMKNGIDPVPVHGGLGGAYYFRNCHGENAAIVKPTDEEPYAPNNPKGFVGKALGQPGLKRSVRVGETGYREVAAYLLDFDHFANVPFTAIVKVSHSIFNVNDGVKGGKNPLSSRQVSKIASLQQFIPHDCDASDHGTSSFPVSDVHRIGILDIRILNTDRHAGNLLVRKPDGAGNFSQVELVPIDHGLCLPESLEDPYFEWIHWPQASIPFSEDELRYIENLDPIRDSEMLRMELPMIREACIRVLVICTIFLKEAASFGLCLAEIGEMISREFRGHDEKPSELEFICIEARMLLDKRETAVSEEVASEENEQFQFEVDSEDDYNSDWTAHVEKLASGNSWFRSKCGNGRNPLSKLEESVDEAEEEAESEKDERDSGGNDFAESTNQEPTVQKLSKWVKGAQLEEKSWQLGGVSQKGSHSSGASSGNRSVNEQVSANTSFVKFGDMNEPDWAQYLENFQKLLHHAFSNRKPASVGQRQRQRLGTSCQF